MQHVKKTAMLVLMITAMMPALAFGLDTAPYGPTCLRSGTPCVLSGTSFEVTGTVASFERGSGLVISTPSSERITIYGIGPERFWDEVEIDYPSVGEAIEATVYTCPSTDRNIALNITIGGETLQLRDPVTGRPLWRGGAGRGRGN